jgi:hypothetical protein
MINVPNSYRVVCIAVNQELDASGFESKQGQEIVSSKLADLFWGQPSLPIQWVLVFLQGVNRSELEVKHLHLVPRLRMSGGTPLLPLHAFMAWKGQLCLFTHLIPMVTLLW